MPAVPALSTQPMTTSSISSPATPARRTAWSITWPSNVGDFVLLKAPLYARAIGVRAVETMTASLMMSGSWGYGCEEGRRGSVWRPGTEAFVLPGEVRQQVGSPPIPEAIATLSGVVREPLGDGLQSDLVGHE